MLIIDQSKSNTYINFARIDSNDDIQQIPDLMTIAWNVGSNEDDAIAAISALSSMRSAHNSPVKTASPMKPQRPPTSLSRNLFASS
jgi:hypothetical protein